MSGDQVTHHDFEHEIRRVVREELAALRGVRV